MDRILRNTSSQITLSLYDQNGALVDADGTVTVRVTDGADAEHIAQANAQRLSEGVYAYTLTPAQTARLDVYTATWTASIGGVPGNVFTKHYEVVGGHLFTVAEARAFDNGKLANTDTYPQAVIVDGRELVEQHLEQLCGVSFVRRGGRAIASGTGDQWLRLPDLRIGSLYAVTVDDVTLTAPELADLDLFAEEGRIKRPYPYWAVGQNNIVVHYEYGYIEPPLAVKRAGLMLLVDRLVASNVEDRAVSISDDLGTRQLAVAGRTGPTGVPEVDAVIAQYTERVPSLA